jgi:hypothetical protein
MRLDQERFEPALSSQEIDRFEGPNGENSPFVGLTRCRTFPFLEITTPVRATHKDVSLPASHQWENFSLRSKCQSKTPVEVPRMRNPREKNVFKRAVIAFKLTISTGVARAQVGPMAGTGDPAGAPPVPV